MTNENLPDSPSASDSPAPPSARTRKINVIMWIAVGAVAAGFLVYALMNMSKG